MTRSDSDSGFGARATPAGPEARAGCATVAGIDLGGTKILGHAIDVGDPLGEHARARATTPRGGRAIIDAIAGVVSDLSAALSGSGPTGRARTIAAVGVGAPGLVDLDGVLRFAPNLPGVVDLDMARQLRDELGVPVVVGNDATFAMAAEHRVGAAKGARDAILVTLGTGIGAGIVVGGELQLGSGGFAGEPGHMVIDPAGPPCPCGRQGCWERLGSGSGLGRLARDAADAGLLDHAVGLAGGMPEAVRGEHVTRSALAGDPDSVEVFRQFAWWVALGIANLVNILDPELVLVGGGLADAGDLLLGPVREAFRGLVLAADHRPPVRIEPALLGPEAGAVGAALLAADLVD
jgi:glucokinase